MSWMRHCLRAIVGSALLGALLLGGSALTPALAVGNSDAGGPPALADYLDAQGRLQLPAGYSGALDPGGYRMQTAADGQPVFVAKSANPDADKAFGQSRGCDSFVRAMAAAPSGLIYLGGFFSVCDDVVSASVVSYDPRTRRFAPLGAGLGDGAFPDLSIDAEVLSFAVSGTDLYVGGVFTLAGGLPANNIARWDGSRWSALGEGLNGRVSALAVSGNTLYAGGSFSSAGGQPARRIARWDGQAWHPLGSGANNQVTSLAARGDEVYASGAFTEIGGLSIRGIARWDGSAWQDLGEGSHGGPLAFLGNDLIAGEVTGSPGNEVFGLARWDGQGWSSFVQFGGGAAGDIAVVGSDLIVTGDFNRVGSTPARRIARYRNGIWSALGTSGADGVGSWVESVAASGNKVFVGGAFREAGGVAVNHTAFFDGNGWAPLGSDKPPGIEGEVKALLVDGDRLVAAGEFNLASGLPAAHIASWNGTAWFPYYFGSGFGGGGITRVHALAHYAGRVCAGGSFETAGGRPARNVACWNGSEWSALGDTAADGTDGLVYALAEHAGELYAGGSFGKLGGVAATNVARWNGSRWAPLGGGSGEGVNGVVYALVVHQESIHVAGDFNQAGGVRAIRVARWQGDTWTALDTGLGIERIGYQLPQEQVRTLASDGERLYAGGLFTALVGSGREYRYVAHWNGSTWTYLDGGIGGTVYSLALIDGGLYASGSFRSFPSYGLARWNGAAWGFLRYHMGEFPVVADGPSLIYAGDQLVESPLASLQSRAAGGADGASSSVAVSRQRARIVFASSASNLVPGDPDAQSDVFVRDPLSGAVARVSDAASALAGDPLEGYAEPAVSADGGRVAFSGSSGQVFVVADGAARVASSDAAGVRGNGPSSAPQLPGLGARVLFASQATNLRPEVDGNGSVSDIYAKDLASGGVSLVSAGPGGEPANGASIAPWASDDGSAVAFATRASNLISAGGNPGTHFQAVLLRGGERPARLYLSRNPATGALGNGDSTEVRITPDGRFGVFTSTASNLVDGDSNGTSDVFRFEIADDRLVRLERVSTSIHGRQANGSSRHPSISDDGQFIAFESDASNLVPIDRGGYTDVFVKWHANGEVQRTPRTPFDEPSNGHSTRPALSGDGWTVAFVSAGQLAVGDNNGHADVYAADLHARGPGYFTGPLDEPAVSQLALPGPVPSNTSCPAGFFVAQAADGPGAGLTAGTFGMELVLDEPGTRTLAGGLNFGGLIDSGQVGFAGFNILNERNEPQRVDVRLTGSPASSSSASLPVRVRIARRTASSSETVFEASTTISLSAPFVGSVDVPPGFYEVTVGPLSGTVGGAPEGQFFFGLATGYLDRPGGGFEGGAVVGGYHAEHPFGGVSGFAAFCLATPHSASVRLLSQPSYGPAGARDLRLRVLDTQSREVLILPAE